jgi:regulator of replication initiation timing
LEGQRHALEKVAGAGDAEKMRRDVLDLIQQIASWEESLEAIRLGTAAVLAERDRWQIAHDKLRERIDRHALEPRTGDSAQPPPSRTARTAAAPSQDYSVIDRELERLNESMLRALSSD